MFSFSQFLAEEAHSFSSTQVDLPAHVGAQIMKYGATIPDADVLHREDHPHITVKYGGLFDTVEPVRMVLQNEPPIIVTLGQLAYFPNADADVVIVKVHSVDLARINAKLAASLDYREDTYEYTPHATIAYVKPGTGKRYASAVNWVLTTREHPLAGLMLTFDTIMFSPTTGVMQPVRLCGERSQEGWQTAPLQIGTLLSR